MRKIYAYAVIDGNEAPDQFRSAQSVHDTLDDARDAADELNTDPNDHYYAIEWGDVETARLRPSPHPHPQAE